MKLILIIPLILIVLPLLLGLIRTWKVQNSPNQKLFLKGHIPSPLPDGLYKGSVGNIKTGWEGKKFDASSSSGINLISGKEQYPFKTYAGKGLADNIDVLKIDYNLPQNPFWLRFILDEIVEVEKGKFLGKVHLNLIPGLPFSLGYFRLEK